MSFTADTFRDHKRWRARQNRAQRIRGAADDGFMANLVAEEFAIRLAAINRRFERVLDFGSAWQRLPTILDRALPNATIERASIGAEPGEEGEYQRASLSKEGYDLALSAFGLHWVNDVPATLAAIRSALKPDGLFLAVIPGRGTLEELRLALIAAETAASGGAAARVDHFADISQAGALLQTAGFALPVADVERLQLSYGSAMELVDDLRKQGACGMRPGLAPLPRNIQDHLEREYRNTSRGFDGRLRACVNLVFLTGWSPHESQQKPLAPGSAQTSLTKVLGKSRSS